MHRMPAEAAIMFPRVSYFSRKQMSGGLHVSVRPWPRSRSTPLCQTRSGEAGKPIKGKHGLSQDSADGCHFITVVVPHCKSSDGKSSAGSFEAPVPRSADRPSSFPSGVQLRRTRLLQDPMLPRVRGTLSHHALTQAPLSLVCSLVCSRPVSLLASLSLL